MPLLWKQQCTLTKNRVSPLLPQAVHDAKSEEIGPGIYRFKAELGTAFLLSHCSSMSL